MSELCQFDRPLELFKSYTPVAVELRPGCEQLPQFDHPEDAVYLFGPEDGILPEVYLRLCHRFVAIPARHCLNLASAVTAVLYDRQSKLQPELRLEEALQEERIWNPLGEDGGEEG
jgi:tRNA(Leu) C34 or U34 (ribose-2'-O)-methylase TrmL